MSERESLLVIAGPTASGKTACAVELCHMIDGEVVSADSMQIYRGMEILSAAPSNAERQGIPHHMIGIVEPETPFSAAKYRDMADEAIRSIRQGGRIPVVCGGTGLYIDALTRPMRFSEQSDPALHEKLLAMAEEPGGRDKLHRQLAEVDPDSAQRLHQNDVRRVVRALEIYLLTGTTITEQNRRDAEAEDRYRTCMFALEWPREVLYERIERRVDEMFHQGLVEEVRRLMSDKSAQPTAVQAIGYKEIALALNGRCTMDDAIQAVKQATRNFAKRQMTWFRRRAGIHWICAEGRSARQIAAEILETAASEGCLETQEDGGKRR